MKILQFYFAGLIMILWVNVQQAKDEACVKWGNTFDVSLESANVLRNCAVLDEMTQKSKKICCAAIGKLNETDGIPRIRPSS